MEIEDILLMKMGYEGRKMWNNKEEYLAAPMTWKKANI